MAANTSETPILLLKKLGGVLLLILGFVLTAVGFGGGSTMVTVLGFLLLAGGMALLALKILRRNQ